MIVKFPLDTHQRHPSDGPGRAQALLADIRADAREERNLLAHTAAVEEIAAAMLGAEVDDRLAGSYSFMTMLSILTVAWLMARQNGLRDGDAAADLRPPFVAGKRAAARFFLDHLVPEAIGLKASAMTGSALLCGISDEALA